LTLRGPSDKVKEDLKTRIPLGRMGCPRDVAAAIVFLASDEAGYITGHVLDVNGGMYLASVGTRLGRGGPHEGRAICNNFDAQRNSTGDF
jgi:hypothetical protein